MEDKLYQFLLLDKSVLSDSSTFCPYGYMGMYKKLGEKYFISFVYLEYLLQLAKLELEDFDSREEALHKKLIVLKERMIKEFGFKTWHFELYESMKNGRITQRDEDSLKTWQEKDLEVMEEYYNMTDTEKLYYENYKLCTMTVRNIKKLKQIFYQSYGFNEKYEESQAKWINHSGDRTVYFLKILEKFYTIEINSLDETDDSSRIQPRHRVLFKIINSELEHYLLYDKDKKAFKKKYNSIDAYSIESIEQLIECYMKMKEDENNYKTAENLLQNSSIGILARIAKESRSEILVLQEYLYNDKDLKRYIQLCEKLEKCIEIFNVNRAKRIEKAEAIIVNGEIIKTKEEVLAERKVQARKQKQNRMEAYDNAIGILRDMQNQKRDALNKIRERLDRKVRYVDEAYYTSVDIGLYKTLFTELKSQIAQQSRIIKGEQELNKESEKKSRRVKDNRNNFYIYNDKVIITINFPNTKNEKYKTAAVIVDKDDLQSAYIDSKKLGWTYKYSRKASDKIYAIKTLKPDLVTADSRKMDLLKIIYDKHYHEEGIQEKNSKEYYVTISHKFDLRSKNIKKIHKLSNKSEERYHQGLIRIKEDGNDEEVCFNGENNITDASILYFNDSKKFANFLDNL